LCPWKLPLLANRTQADNRLEKDAIVISKISTTIQHRLQAAVHRGALAVFAFAAPCAVLFCRRRAAAATFCVRVRQLQTQHQ